MGQDYPPTRPSPGANFPFHPPSPVLVCRDLPEGRIPLGHLFFFFVFGQFFHHTEDLVQFGGQVFDLLLERDGGDLLVLVDCV